MAEINATVSAHFISRESADNTRGAAFPLSITDARRFSIIQTLRRRPRVAGAARVRRMQPLEPSAAAHHMDTTAHVTLCYAPVPQRQPFIRAVLRTDFLLQNSDHCAAAITVGKQPHVRLQTFVVGSERVAASSCNAARRGKPSNRTVRRQG